MSNSASDSTLRERGDYTYENAELNHSHAYLLPAVEAILAPVRPAPGSTRKLFELGCGNGSVAARFARLGFDVTGVDPSAEGIQQAHQQFPALNLHEGSAYDDLPAKYGRFPIVTSFEVVEHVYFPRKFAATLYNLLEPGGIAIVSTPYHGYLKNLALALTGKMDGHFTALWDHGHIKFWSMDTLRALLQEAGFISIEFHRVGRFAPLAKSMIAVARK